MSDTLRCSHGYLLGQCTVCAAMPDVRYWRKRAIAAEGDLGATEAERDTLRAALADRDQQIAALRQEVKAMRPVVEAATHDADATRERRVVYRYEFDRLWNAVDAYRSGAWRPK